MINLDIRKEFIKYFEKKGHTHQDSSSLIPADDKSLLFTNSGMVQFKDFFLGVRKPRSTKIVTCQKCVRAGGKHNDLDNIGFTNRHHSFFEMLGNFSFGEYFKEEAISYAWDFLVNTLNIPKEKLYVSVHKDDEEAMSIWQNNIGLTKDRIWVLDDADNFWQMGSTGPCGPCTEIYYDYGKSLNGEIPTKGDPGDRYVEIWNLVFTQYNKDKDGILHDLPMKCVDTGMGLERIQALLEGQIDNYDSSAFSTLSQKIDKLIKPKRISSSIKKIIMDHSRSACMLISDGVIPSSDGRGYVLRRIIRRATRYLYNLGINEPFIYKLTEVINDNLGDIYSNLRDKINQISETIQQEEENYLGTLDNGLKLIDKLTKKTKNITGADMFKLYDTYGFPKEIIEEIAIENELILDLPGFQQLMNKQRINSKTASNFKVNEIDSEITKHQTQFIGYNHSSSTGKVVDIVFSNQHVRQIDTIDEKFYVILDKTVFYPEGGGQISDSGFISNTNCKLQVTDVKRIQDTIVHLVQLKDGKLAVGDNVEQSIDENKRYKTAINHSATHLMHHSLRETLGNHVEQKGSLVTEDYLRFDFSHNKALSHEQIGQIEDQVTLEISRSIDTQSKNMSFKEAMKLGALAFFDEKYGDDVRVIFIGSNSIELCGGTHVSNTRDIGLFKIISESSISTGVRRIEAITSQTANTLFNNLHSQSKYLSQHLNVKTNQIADKIIAMKKEDDDNKKLISSLNKKIAKLYYNSLKSILTNQTKIFIHECNDLTSNQMRMLSDVIKSEAPDSISILFKDISNGISCLIGVSKKCKHVYNSKKIVSELMKKFDCKGGGSDSFASCIITRVKTDELKDFVLTLFK